MARSFLPFDRTPTSLLAAALAMLLLAAPVAAQTISGVSVNTSGSSGNSGNSDGSTRSQTQILTNNGTTVLNTRFAWNISADVGVFSTRDQSGGARHNVNFTVNSPVGYSMAIATRQTGRIQRNSDAGGCDGRADRTSTNGFRTGPGSFSGTLSLPDPGGFGNGGGTTGTNFNNTANATITDTSNGANRNHQLDFTWSGSVRSNSCEAAVRQGAGSSVTGCGACVYPGSPGRTQSNDGHFVSITVTHLCGNGVVNAGEQCDLGGQNGAGTSCCTSNCQFRGGGQLCRASAGVCDPAETCTGGSGNCPGDAKSNALCRAAADVCDIAEFCDGVNNTCPANGFEPNTTVCRSSAGVCDPAENCPGNGASCPGDAKSNALCRAAADVCDIAEFCDGVNNGCPANGFEPNTTVCRPSAGDCDIAENCTGVSAPCPANVFEPNTTVCRASGGVCDLAENCPGGSATCPGDVKSVALCRGSGGVCDLAEFCDGVNNDCPVDAKSVAECRASAGVCDIAENCDGVGNDCPTDAVEPNTTECRASAGVCDVAENCDGAGVDCPADLVEPNTTECRAAADICDIAENCNGEGVDCPVDAFEPSTTECRAVADICDVAENCTGSGAACPTDDFEPSTTECRAAVDVCDAPENCTGGGVACPADLPEATTTVCRAATGQCDVAENCDGVLSSCPADQFVVAGTPCNDGDNCTELDACDGLSDNCASQPVDCNDVNPCTDDSCSDTGGGFLCLNVNNGLCIGPNCGNAIIDVADGETCDPPTTLDPNDPVPQFGCRFDCTACGDGVIQLQNGETCDDANAVSGCGLNGKPQKPLDACLNNCTAPMCDDPAQIRWGSPPKLDRYKLKGRLISDAALDIAGSNITIEITKNSGADVVLRASLSAGNMEQRNERNWRFKSRDAKIDGGMSKLKIVWSPTKGYYKLGAQAYGDYQEAVSDMTTTVHIGQTRFVWRGLWDEKPKGFKFNKRSTLLPVE